MSIPIQRIIASSVIAAAAYVGLNSIMVQTWLPYSTDSRLFYFIVEGTFVLVPVLIVLFGLRALGASHRAAVIGIGVALLSLLVLNGFSSGAFGHFLVEVAALAIALVIFRVAINRLA